MAKSQSEKYGGDWTKRKLEMLRAYLNAYTTALKNKPFKLLYIDAFAGTGSVELPAKGIDGTREIVQFVDDSARDVIEGSAMIATKIYNKKFDELIFIEQNKKRCQDLKALAKRYASRNIRVKQAEANAFLVELCQSWQAERGASWRGVLFLDPFGAQVEWTTIESIANTKAMDMWIWIPVSGLSRMLPVDKKPEDISGTLAQTLDKVFGGAHREKFYKIQIDLFQEPRSSRARGVEMIRTVYKDQLWDVFGARLLKDSRLFYNDKGSPSFEFVFCTGSENEKAITLAHKIASHIIKAKE